MLNKKIAQTSIGIDVDPTVISNWKSAAFPIKLFQQDAVTFLREYHFLSNEFVYADPPYLAETRKGRSPYRFDYSIAQHTELLLTLRSLPCAVMVSGYWSELYCKYLQGWRAASFQLRTRSGEVATEWVWMNYDAPLELHDYRFIGMDFRERERIKRKQERWVKRLRQMTQMEREALLVAIQSESARGWA